MNNIFKYTSLTNAIHILKNDSVILNNPNTFNDPYDCSFKYDSNDKKFCKLLIKNYSILKVLYRSKNNTY